MQRSEHDENDLYVHCWGSKNDIYVGTEDGDIFYFSNIHAKGEPITETDDLPNSPIRCLEISKHHFIVGSDDGILRFFDHKTRELHKQVVVTTAPDRDSEFRYILLTGDFASVIVSTLDGQLYQVTIKGYNDPTPLEQMFKEAETQVKVVWDNLFD